MFIKHGINMDIPGLLFSVAHRDEDILDLLVKAELHPSEEDVQEAIKEAPAPMAISILERYPQSEASITKIFTENLNSIDVTSYILSEYKLPNPILYSALIYYINNHFNDSARDILNVYTVPADQIQRTMDIASLRNNYEMVQYFLTHYDIPQDQLQQDLQIAIYRNKADMVRLLLTDSRVDPSYNNNQSYKYALQQRRVQIATILQNNPRFHL